MDPALQPPLSTDYDAPAAADDARALAENILESITDGFIALDRQWRFTYVNSRAEHLLSRSRIDLLGKNHWEEYSGTVGTIVESEYRRAVAQQVTVEFESYSKRWHRWLEFKAYPAAHGLSVYFRDITDRKRAEEASRRSEQELSDFFETATIGLHWVGPDGVILRVNQAELDLLGYSRDEYLGHHIAEFHADLPVIEDILACLAKDEKLKDYPARMRCKDGSIKYVRIDSSVLWQDGKFVHTRCFMRDVTDYKRAEEAVRENVHRLRLAQQVAHIGTFDWNLQSGVIRWTPELEAMHGLLPGGFGGTRSAWQELIHPDDRARTLQQLYEAMPKGVFESEWRVNLSDGEVRWLSGRASLFRDEAGNPRRWIGVNIDITDRKHAEEIHAHLAAIVESSNDAVVSKDLDGIVKTWNKGAERIFGYTAEEVIGRSIQLLIPQEMKHEEADILARLRRGERIEHYETSRLRKDGERIAISLSISPMKNAAGQIIGAAKIARDITEKKLAEEQIFQLNQHLEVRVQERTSQLAEANAKLIAQAEKLTAINAELERFAYVSSHDLQEPLRMVSSFTQLLARRYEGKLDADADDFIKYAVEGAHRMEHLIKDLLDYSRLGARETELGQVNVEEVWDQAIMDLKIPIDKSGAVLTHDPLPTVTGDATQIRQVFQNLLGNAIKFSHAAPQIHSWAERKGDEWVFAVRDNGIGIEQQYLDRIFEVFQRLHSRGEYQGTGIGLAICKRVVENHRGRIWVESVYGKGSTFYFALPVGDAASLPLPLAS
jgi:two-component system sensor histidine kinase VicK